MDAVLLTLFRENWNLDPFIEFHYSVWCKMYGMPRDQQIQFIKDYIAVIGGRENWLNSDIRSQHGDAYWKELGFE